MRVRRVLPFQVAVGAALVLDAVDWAGWQAEELLLAPNGSGTILASATMPEGGLVKVPFNVSTGIVRLPWPTRANTVTVSVSPASTVDLNVAVVVERDECEGDT